MLLAAAVPLLALAAAPTTPGVAAAQDPVTFYEDVAPILAANCVSCHQSAGANIGSLVAPMPLITYEQTRPWARSIAQKVRTREMPPWFADEPKGVFSNERGLTESQIQTIVAWVAAGAPAGDKSKAPAPPTPADPANGGYSFGKPDLIVKAEPFQITDDQEDVHVNFHVKIPEALLSHDVLVGAYEFRAGTYMAGKDTVHHMCGGLRSPGEVAADASGDNGEGDASLSLGCIAGGAEPNRLPEGFGLELKKGSTVTMSMHYAKEKGPGSGYMNQPEIGFYFAKGPIKYQVRSKNIGTTGFEIPPFKSAHRIGAGELLQKDTLVLAWWPHAHLRAASARYTATYPDGRKEVLLNVPRYDQTWQVTYKYRQPKLLPKGTHIDVEMVYDNTERRAAMQKFNPNDTVRNGPRTQDEMMLGFFNYVELEPGDPILTAGRD
jgi:mono/diheme cytochrome c family protein